jgi:DNA polymerase I-like protein with 3'-5' exonuclease and polymerase domains
MAKRRDKIMPGQLPLFVPESSWKPLPPSQWPDFRAHSKFIGVDTETHDPNLQTKGPGFIRRDAKLCGISLANEHGETLYLPIGHPEDNVEDVDQALAYLRYQLGGPQVKCGANLTYELEALRSVGVDLAGDLGDIQIAEPLLDEDRPDGYSLEVLAQSYLGVGKDEDLLREAAVAYSVDAKKGMAYIPARFVAPYAEEDARLPIEIFAMQMDQIDREDLMSIFKLEQRLQRVLFKMRCRGVRIDVEKAAELSKRIQAVDEPELLRQIREQLPLLKNPNSTDDLARALQGVGVDVPTTVKGNASVTNDWLKEQKHPACQLLNTYRKTVKMRRDFIDTLVDDSVDGRIYSNWKQLRTQDEGESAGGTRSGRVAATKFNLTQVPSRDPTWGPAIRSLFIADEGKTWVKNDYSQQEPRHTLHFAYVLGLDGAAEARQRYIEDPGLDYHQLTADLVRDRAGRDIGRRPAKDINLGATYGMGKAKLMEKLGVAQNIAEEILAAYHEGVPYVKQLERKAMERAEEKGFVRTLLGRKRRFDSWEPVDRNSQGYSAGMIRGLANAQAQWGGRALRRSMTHKALNAIIQGSAADQMKMSLVLLDEAGLCPQIQVYDEVNGSYDATPEMLKQMQEIMETSVESTIPFLAEPETGPSWGEVS